MKPGDLVCKPIGQSTFAYDLVGYVDDGIAIFDIPGNEVSSLSNDKDYIGILLSFILGRQLADSREREDMALVLWTTGDLGWHIVQKTNRYNIGWYIVDLTQSTSSSLLSLDTANSYQSESSSSQLS